MFTCPSCLRSIPDRVETCPSCGAVVSDESTPTRHQTHSADHADEQNRRASTTLIIDSAPSYSEGRFVAGSVLLGRYRVVALVGKGGMGEVYKAEDLKLSQVVALKFLPKALAFDGAMLARFHNEVRIARQVSHSAVCRVYDIGDVDGRHFISMEFIDGEDLATLLRRIGRLPGDKAVDIARQICAGLAAAHNSGVLHRDLKPANIMIDGRGNARITDFGLAVVSEELRGDEVAAGTPAYMAPEQLTGRVVTQRSDIYALGLVLYELFTGKRVFEVNDIYELVKLHQQSWPTLPTSHVKDIDPLVERVIMRCLERDPKQRPATATQVAAALPGGDPLAAALAVGETPSPEMVAAATKEGALRPVVAVACLAGFVVLLALLLLLSGRVFIHRSIPLEKPPEVLAERAAAFINKIGYSNPPADQAYGFDLDTSYLEYVRTDLSSDRWKRINSGQPLTYFFWYRQSPRTLEPSTSTRITLVDPPLQTSGMTSVIMDPRGRLVRFNAVPPEFDPSNEPAAAIDWSLLFADAGLDLANFKPSEPQWSPQSFADSRKAWEGNYADHPDVPIRIEGASYRGKPVYFRVIAPWDTPTHQEDSPSSWRTTAAALILIIVLAIVVAGAVVLARRNLRIGRGDRAGAFKLAVFIFSVMTLGTVIGADHVNVILGELLIIYRVVTYPLFFAAFLWLLYIGLEPYVRRYWPQLLISWSRLMSGDFRNPMVGRDVLAGGLLGMGHTAAIYSAILVSQAVEGFSGGAIRTNPVTLGGFRDVIEDLLGSLGPSVFGGVAPLLFLLLLYIFLRNQWAAAAVMWLIIAAVEILFFATSWPTAPANLIIATLMVVAVFRFGLLTAIVWQFVFFLSVSYPLTTDFSIWYSNRTILCLVVLMALAIYGTRVSLGGQKLFSGKLLED